MVCHKEFCITLKIRQGQVDVKNLNKDKVYSQLGIILFPSR